MARSRNIKPGFFKNEMLAECSPLARLLFAGLWCLADRAGRLEDRPKRIRAEVQPYDDGSVDDMLAELQAAGFVLRYQVDGQRFIQVVNFEKHQNPHCHEQASTIPAPGKHSACTVQLQDSHMARPADSLNLIPDTGFLIPDNPAGSPSASKSADDGFSNFWKLYPKKVAKPKALKAWKKLQPTSALQDAMIMALRSQMSSAEWQKDGGQFIPHPATWLNAHRWEDEHNAHGKQALQFGSLENQDYAKGITHDGRF